MEFGVSIAGDEVDRRKFIQQFMRELCRRDDEVNRGQGNSNVFNIEKIRQAVLVAFELEYMSLFIRGYAMEEDPDIELIDDENVTLTERTF
jgi:hypothetical protein